ncbi:hypothetical protein EVAR_22200_1 [Eumeta japonica]|uniref:Uncharacterized protein n=1 Tax=Eumeta variegata TaxID=151549 RepID=A0A4C1UA78_EUMVA|nr:hypothetical protein EVAR_22200_1 [Eumeta japonica]
MLIDFTQTMHHLKSSNVEVRCILFSITNYYNYLALSTLKMERALECALLIRAMVFELPQTMRWNSALKCALLIRLLDLSRSRRPGVDGGLLTTVVTKAMVKTSEADSSTYPPSHGTYQEDKDIGISTTVQRGMMEDLDQTLERYLTKVLADHQKSWDLHIPFLLISYGIALHESINATMAFGTFG